MTDSPREEAQARVRRHRWLTWAWIVPIVAAAIVLWLGARALLERGPSITITFDNAEGLQAGQTKIRHKDVELGTVESIHLDRDMSRVIVHARVTRAVRNHLNEHTRFWIVRPRVTAAGISGLSTLVSGAYIEMYPGGGPSSSDFVGLEEPPVLTPNEPGHEFTLHAPDVGSLNNGSPVSYRGLAVGEVLGYVLDKGAQQVDIYAFIRAPYDRLVRPETRFWNAGGVDVSVGTQGIRFRASTLQQLLTGGVAFDTPIAALAGAASPTNAQFRLYDDEYSARHDPRVLQLYYRVDLHGTVRGIGVDSSVELQGTTIGHVTDAHLEYDIKTQELHTPITLAIDPSIVQGLGAGDHPTGELTTLFNARLAEWVKRGLRAHLTTANFLTGQQVVSLDFVPDAHPATIGYVGTFIQIPSSSSTDVTEILQNLRSILKHVDQATAGPELKHAIESLDHTLTHLDQITHDVEPDIKPLIASLRQTAESAQRTLEAAGSVIGTQAAAGTDLARLMRELTDTARSVRALADYLDQHPEALIRGRTEDKP